MSHFNRPTSSSRANQAFIKGQILFQEGQTGDRSFRILSGEVLIYKTSRSGKSIPIAQVGPKEFLGEMDLVNHVYMYSSSAMAITAEVEVEVFFQEEIEKILQPLSSSTRDIFWALSQRLRQTTSQYSNQYSKQVFWNQ